MGNVIAVTIIIACWLISLVVAYILGKNDGWIEALDWSIETMHKAFEEAEKL